MIKITISHWCRKAKQRDNYGDQQTASFLNFTWKKLTEKNEEI